MSEVDDGDEIVDIGKCKGKGRNSGG